MNQSDKAFHHEALFLVHDLVAFLGGPNIVSSVLLY